MLPEPFKHEVDDHRTSLQQLGLSERTSRRISLAPYLPCLISLNYISKQVPKSVNPDRLAEIYFKVAQATRLLELYIHLARKQNDDIWDSLAVSTIKTHFIGFIQKFAKELAELSTIKPYNTLSASKLSDEFLIKKLKLGTLTAEVKTASHGGADLGQLVVFSEAFRRKAHQLTAILESARKKSGKTNRKNS
jgi:hypothetical protein